jgi:iron complex transport system permease protein
MNTSSECTLKKEKRWNAFRTLNLSGVSASLILATVLAVLFIFSFAIGRYPVSPVDVIKTLWSVIFSLDITLPPNVENVVINLRFPRIFAAMLVGASLSVAGTSFQGLFRNPLVSPDILGVASGAGFGAALGIIISGHGFIIQVLSFTGAMMAVALSYFISRVVKGNQTLGLILAGIAIGSLFNAFLSLMKYAADTTDQLPTITYWLMGSLNAVDRQDILVTGLPMLAGITILMLMRWRLNVLAMGEEEAMALGINTDLLRGVVVVCCTVITASAVCISGIIGWVGLVIPHIGRMVVGPCHRKLIPVSALLGATFLLFIDDLCRVIARVEIPIGILTAIIGVPFFLYLLAKGRRGWA